MRRFWDLVIDGLLIAVPLLVLVFLLAGAIGFMRELMQPVAELAPRQRVAGIAALDLIAVAMLLLALAFLGALSRSVLGHRIWAGFERVVLRRIPGFMLFKSLAMGFSSSEHDPDFQPVLVAFEDHAEVGFIVEDDGRSEQVLVFLPGTPTPASGSLVVMQRAQVQWLDVPSGVVVAAVTRFGLGLQALLQVPEGGSSGMGGQPHGGGPEAAQRSSARASASASKGFSR